MFKLSESYIISIDADDNSDTTVMSVAKVCGNKLKMVNILYGTHAELIHEKLTNTTIERGNKDE